jgi:maltooligosyltrehalose trehalohydrolase
LHRDLLELRRGDRLFSAQSADAIDGAVIGPEAFALRYCGEGADDRLVIVNLGRDLDLSPCPEPLLAPARGADWELAWSSEDVKYGGDGTRASAAASWQVPAHAALVYRATPGTRETPRLPGQDESD